MDRLVSCGKENIRFWRIKNGHLPAQTVVLNHHARNTVFTAIDYEFSYQDVHTYTFYKYIIKYNNIKIK